MKTCLILGFSIALFACGGRVVIPAEASGSASGAGGASTTTTTTSSTGGDGDGTTVVAVGTTGVGGGSAICGGKDGFQCGPGEYCVFASHNCGGDDDPGTCAPKPPGCDEPPPIPVCGCGGKIYASPCLAAVEGVDVDTLPGACITPANGFACGKTFCTIGIEFCEGLGGELFCAPLPPKCLLPNGDNCGCLLECECTGNPGELTAICSK